MIKGLNTEHFRIEYGINNDILIGTTNDVKLHFPINQLEELKELIETFNQYNKNNKHN